MEPVFILFQEPVARHATTVPLLWRQRIDGHVGPQQLQMADGLPHGALAQSHEAPSRNGAAAVVAGLAEHGDVAAVLPVPARTVAPTTDDCGCLKLQERIGLSGNMQ